MSNNIITCVTDLRRELVSCINTIIYNRIDYDQLYWSMCSRSIGSFDFVKSTGQIPIDLVSVMCGSEVDCVNNIQNVLSKLSEIRDDYKLLREECDIEYFHDSDDNELKISNKDRCDNIILTIEQFVNDALYFINETYYK